MQAEVLNAVDPNWLTRAGAGVDGFKAHVRRGPISVFALEASKGHELAKELNYRLHLDPDNRRAKFEPRT